MIQTLSNLTIIIYAIAVMTMLLDTTPACPATNSVCYGPVQASSRCFSFLPAVFWA